jgi:hypothetical protein
MTTAFQTVIDYAQSISINKTRKVAQTISRDGVVRSTSLGGQTWQFEVTMPDGLSWTTMRPLIEKMEALDRTTTGTIRINKSGHSYISGYQGNFTNTGSITASYSTGNTITLVSSPVLTTGYKFKSGDFVQLGASGKVYSVVDDVIPSSTTVTLHRPVRDSSGTYVLFVGQAVSWSVLCIDLPRWEIFDRNQVRWTGPFRFAEVV